MRHQSVGLTAGLAAAAILMLGSGLLLYSLSDVPFGSTFDTVLLLFTVGLVSLLAVASIFCFRSRHVAVKWLGAVVSLLALVSAGLAIIVLVDVRVLYFRSLPPQPTTNEWIEDLHALADQMSEKHSDLRALVSEEQWKAAVEEIERRIPSLTDSEILMELFRLSALPNDNHSFPFIMIPCFDLHSFPLVVYGFPEGWYIVNAGREYADLVGARLLSIGGQSIDDIYGRYPLLLAAENGQSRKERFTYTVMLAEWLAYHGIIDDTGEAEFMLEGRDGANVAVSLPSVQFYPQFLWSNLNSIANAEPPVFTNPRQEFYTQEVLAGGRVLYVQFNQCENQPGRETVDEFARSLERRLDSSAVDRCIVDLRNNDGGNPVYGELVRVLRESEQINQPGRLFVLIGRRTASAAVMFATLLQMQTRALFVGEPTGQGPIFFGGPRLIELPNSRLMFAVSSYRAISGLPFDGRNAIVPDFPVAFGIKDYREGRDPVLSAALNYAADHLPAHPPLAGSLQAYTGRFLLNETLVMDVREEQKKLRAEITDFIPNSTVRFITDLDWVSGSRFSTHVQGVFIRFPPDARSVPPRAVLNWTGKEKVLERAPADYVLPFELLSAGDVVSGCDLIRQDVARHKKLYPDLERTLNRLGYHYLRSGQTASALEVFKLNVDICPESWNAYDSYGEALMVDGQIDSSMAYYGRSLALNPDNANAARVTARLRELR